MENNTKWKHPPMKEGLKMDNSKYKLKKIKMKKDMNFSNIETFIDILDDIEPTKNIETKEGFVPTPIIPGVGLDEKEDYDGNDNIDKKKKKGKGGTLFDYLRYISYIFTYLYILLRFAIYSISEFIYDIFSNDISEDEKTHSERYYNRAFDILEKEFNNKTKKRAVDTELDDTDKGNDMKIISNNLMWLLSIALGSSMSYTFYYYMFYSERLDKTETAILDGGVNTQYNQSEYHGNRVNFLPKGASVNKLAKDLLCESTFPEDSESQFSNLWDLIPSFFYKVLKPIVGIVELFHNLLFVYIPNVVNGEHGFLGKDVIPFIPNIGNLLKSMGLSTNGTKFMLITVMLTTFIYYSGSDFFKYIVGTLSGNPEANFFTLFIYLLIFIVSFGLIYDSFKDLSKTTGLTDLKEGLVGKNVMGSVRENVSGMASSAIGSAKEKTARVIESLKGKKMMGGSNEETKEGGLIEKCQDFDDNQSVFIKSLFGLESIPYIGTFAYPVMLILNILIFFTILFTLFGFGPVAIFLYIIGIFGYSLINSDSAMKDNINIMTQLTPDDKINPDIRVDAEWFNQQQKTVDISDANNYLNKINSFQYQLFNSIIMQNSIVIFIVISLFYSIQDIYKNTKNTNVRTILTILTGSIAALTSIYAYIMSDNKVMFETGDVLKMLGISENDKRFQSLNELLLRTTSYTSDDIEFLYSDFEKLYNNTDENNQKIQGGNIMDNPLLKTITSATTKGLEGISNLITGNNITQDKFTLAIYYSIIKNKFGKYKPLSKMGNEFYDFGKNVHAKQTKYNI